MTQLTFTPPNKVMEVKEFLKKTKNVHEKERARAILKLIEGKPRKLIADIFDITLTTLDTWQKQFKSFGAAGLSIKTQPGNNHLLTQKQKEEIKKIIRNKKPYQVGLEGKFWNVPKLSQLIKKKFKVAYRAQTSYQRLFKFCGFTHHKPAKVNKNQSSHMRRRFADVLKKTSNGIAEKIVWYW